MKKRILIAIILFIIIVGIVSGVMILLFGYDTNREPEISTNETEVKVELTDEEKALKELPNKSVFAIYGVDKNEALADVIMVASVDKNTGKIKVINVPRDTAVKFSPQSQEELEELGVFVPDYEIKINSVHSYASKYGNEYLTKTLEEMLGVSIDNYFEVNLEAFNEIVDTIGGVEVDVPTRLYYRDPTQDLLIDLQPGLQILNGEDAQGFVRFRQYVQGDLDRIQMQQVFIKAMLSQVMAKENIKDNLSSYISTVFKYVNTNMKFSQALKYIYLVQKLDTNDVFMQTLPGPCVTPFIYDVEETEQLADYVFRDIIPEVETSTENYYTEDESSDDF